MGSEKWYVLLFLKGKKPKHGGVFNDELDAAKKFDQLCNEHGISNHETETTTKQQRNRKISQYKGVCWHKKNKKWCARFNLKGASKYKGVCWHKENEKWFVKFNLGKGQTPKYGG